MGEYKMVILLPYTKNKRKERWIVAITAIETSTGTENSVEAGTTLLNVSDEAVTA